MKKRPVRGAGKLRKRAEKRLVARPPVKAARHDVARVVHELEVHQIELEMQNEELRATRRHVEEVLDRQTKLFEHAPIGYVVLDQGGLIREANREAARMLGAARDGLLGRRIALFVADKDRVALADLLDEARARTDEGGPSSTIDVGLSTDGNQGPDVRFVASPLAGIERPVLLAIHDVTAHKRAEHALRGEIRSRDEFLAALSHELRNPLASIRTGLAVLARAEPGTGEARKATDVATRQADHLTKIVDELLDATRVSTGKIQLARAGTDLVELARTVVDDHRSMFQPRGIALESRLAPLPIWVHADATRLAQVLSNLLVNATKFTPRGGRVEVTLRAEGDRALLSVRDDGIGMEPELCDRIFTPFVQGPQPLDRTQGGLGLGLALVKGLVELHGGAVRARSTGPGCGAEFEVCLPIVDAPAPAVEPTPAAPVKGRRVLVIDDAVDNAEVLGDLLSVSGHKTQIAHDGPSGIAIGRVFRPDVVLCDIGLPGMDGYEVARKMRADPALRGAYLVALSGYARAEDRKRSAEAGFDDHLAKPASWDSIARVLARRSPGAAVGGTGSRSAVP